MITDSLTLLADYAANGSDPVFRELVGRYVNLVYTTAIRLVGGDAQLAEDVSQMVFAELARKAQRLPRDVMLGGWLHRHTCFVASKLMRAERRRQSRERRAVEMNPLHDHSKANLAQVAPILNEAINQLGAADRTAILLRFFEQRDLRSVGEALGASENAAQKRITRALEELRALLKERGIALSAAGLATLLTTDAVAAAPAGLALSISSAAGSASAGTASGVTFLKLVTMTKLKTGIVGACVIAGLATSLMVEHQAQARFREQDDILRRQSDQLAQLEAQNRALSGVGSHAASAGPNNPEDLMRLRREVGQLRDQTNALASLQRENHRLQQTLPKTPLQLIKETKEKGILRMNCTREWLRTFHLFAQAHHGQFPANFDQAASFLPNYVRAETNFTTDQFDIVYHGAFTALSNPPTVIVLREKQAWSDQKGQSWVRAYGFADGHSEIHRIQNAGSAGEAAIADASFDDWEKQRMIVPPSSQ